MFKIGDIVKWEEKGFQDEAIYGKVVDDNSKAFQTILGNTYPIQVKFSNAGHYNFTTDGKRIDYCPVVLELVESAKPTEEVKSNRHWILHVEVDTNDGDYVSERNKIENKDEFLSTYLNLITEIKSGPDFSWNDQIDEDDMKHYFDLFGEEFVEEFVGRYFPDPEYGFHRVETIELIEQEIFQMIHLV